MGPKVLTSKVRYDVPEDDANMAKELAAAFQRHSKRTLLIGAKEQVSVTGGKLLDQTGRIATGLIKQVNLKVSDMVLLVTEHCVSEVIVAFSVSRAGGAFYGFFPNDGLHELVKTCKTSSPSIIVTHSWYHHWILELKKRLKHLQDTPVIWIDDPSITTSTDSNNNTIVDKNTISDVTLLDDLLNFSIDQELLSQVAEKGINNKENPFCCTFTSGSTGPPKAVPGTHYEIISCLYSMLSATKYPLPTGELLMPLTQDSVLSGDLPLDHGAGVYTMLLSMCLGSTFVIMPSYDEDVFWQQVQDYRITSSIGSSSFGYRLLRRLKDLIDFGQTNKWDLSSFKTMSCAGARINFENLIREVNQVYDFYVKQIYGFTEHGFTCELDFEHCRSHTQSVGYLLPGVSAKIVDRGTGKLLGENQRGELLISSRSKFKRYLCEEGVDAKKLFDSVHDSDGFYKTGDEASVDEEGRFYLYGRFKETLTLEHDWKVMPSELEELVDQHPLVEQSAVVGVHNPDLVNCDAPKAFVRLIPKSPLDKLEMCDSELRERFLANDYEYISRHIYNYIASTTPTPKHLKGGVRILDDFPRNGLLRKIDRKALKLLD